MSVEHEHALLGAVFLNPKVYDKACEFVTDSDFSSPAMAALWRACGRAMLAGIEPDAITVQDYLNGDSAVADAGGKSLVHSLASACPSVTRWKSYAESIHRESTTYQLRRALQEVLESDAHGEDLLRQAEDALLSVTDERVLGCDMQSALKQIWEEAQQEKQPGVDYPWPKINSATHGMRPGWLCILGGETGHGKTAAALAITESVIAQGKSVLYCSLEMQPSELATRLAQRADFPTEAIYTRAPSSEESAILVRLIQDDAWKRLRIERATTTERIAALVRRFNPQLVVLDHMHLMDTSSRESRYEATTRISRELKLLAGRYRVPILALAQLNRLHGEKEQRVPGLSRLRDSGSIEQDADTVVFVWRKRDENDLLTSEGAMRVAKSRMGVTGTVRMVFHGANQQLDVGGIW